MTHIDEWVSEKVGNWLSVTWSTYSSLLRVARIAVPTNQTDRVKTSCFSPLDCIPVCFFVFQMQSINQSSFIVARKSRYQIRRKRHASLTLLALSLLTLSDLFEGTGRGVSLRLSWSLLLAEWSSLSCLLIYTNFVVFCAFRYLIG